ncbi:MAG: hypothetical protein KKH22_00185 [Proteobacteria bacterium]|nr:hypothetical protein [Pseudomonadota bacterium]
MKKVLSTVAALGLVAGLATTASAVEFKMSGQYLVEGIYMNGGDGGGVAVNETAGTDNTSDSWYQHTFVVRPTMKVNDKISMLGDIRLADNTIWGGQTGGDVEGLSPGSNDVYVHQLYMDYASEIGKIRIGRTSAGPYGTNFLNTDIRQNRIMWWPSFMPKPWNLLFFTAKLTENENVDGTTSATDSDRYEARLGYTTADHDFNVRYIFLNDNSGITERQVINPYAKMKFDNYFVNTELHYNFGDQTATVDYDSLAAMLEVGGKFDALTVSGMYFYAEGDDNTADSDNNQALFGTTKATGTGTGTEFEPLYILTGRTTGLLNPDQNTANSNMATAGVHAFILGADYAVSNQLTLHAAVAYAQADEATQTGGANYAGRDDEYGWEYNIGAAYKLLDNLTYEAHFGYLDTGDFFKSTATTADTDNVYLLTHSLTMTF